MKNVSAITTFTEELKAHMEELKGADIVFDKIAGKIENLETFRDHIDEILVIFSIAKESLRETPHDASLQRYVYGGLVVPFHRCRTVIKKHIASEQRKYTETVFKKSGIDEDFRATLIQFALLFDEIFSLLPERINGNAKQAEIVGKLHQAVMTCHSLVAELRRTLTT